MNILLSGGGTLGSVSALLAAVPTLNEKGNKIFFVGTRSGPERQLVMSRGIQYAYIIAPKFRRYFSFQHFLLPFKLVAALVQAFLVLLMYRPQVIVSAGGYVSVPLVWVGWVLRIPSLIHQQDVQLGLANKLMQPFATTITVAFKDALQDFHNPKARWIGNPARNMEPTTNEFHLEEDVPTVLITGGGTGAQALNDLVTEELLHSAQVIHLTGTDKSGLGIKHERYHRREFLNEEMKEALHEATVVVSRAGLGTITELASLGKAAIIIPMPHTHQEQNAKMLERNNAAITLDQDNLTSEQFTATIRDLLKDTARQKELESNIKGLFKEDSNQLFVEAIMDTAR